MGPKAAARKAFPDNLAPLRAAGLARPAARRWI